MSDLEVTFYHEANTRAVEELTLEQPCEELQARATGEHEIYYVVEDVDQDQANQELGIRTKTPE